MIRSSFRYKIDVENMIVIIIDEDCGGMSVTNDIENVIKYIQGRDSCENFRFVYMDSDRTWNEYCPIIDTWKYAGEADFEVMLWKMKSEVA